MMTNDDWIDEQLRAWEKALDDNDETDLEEEVSEDD